jgi:hypothetical protein
MNAPALNLARDLAAEARMHLGDAVELYDNADAIGERVALAAYERGDPSFWSTASYHAQKMALLQIKANQMPLLAALKHAYGAGADYLAALDRLVPLNYAAAREMSKLYSEMGLWRDEEELLARRLRRSGRP